MKIMWWKKLNPSHQPPPSFSNKPSLIANLFPETVIQLNGFDFEMFAAFSKKKVSVKLFRSFFQRYEWFLLTVLPFRYKDAEAPEWRFFFSWCPLILLILQNVKTRSNSNPPKKNTRTYTFAHTRIRMRENKNYVYICVCVCVDKRRKIDRENGHKIIIIWKNTHPTLSPNQCITIFILPTRARARFQLNKKLLFVSKMLFLAI